ncbi:MAG: NusG domain II-containing protein [Clostridia bacterium]|nr:NusG domain II-containing protein [Clostridia bacterium]
MREQLNKARNSKIFSKGDIIVYIIILILLVGLFLVIFLPKVDKPLEKIQVQYDGNVIYEYDLKTNTTTQINNEFVTEQIDGNSVIVNISIGEAINILVIENNSANMIEANCSIRKDCVYSQKITKGGQTIICLPHKIRVVGIGGLSNDIVL